MIRIVSEGVVIGTKVYDEDGNEIRDIMRIEIQPLDVKDAGVVTAKLTIRARLDVHADVPVEELVDDETKDGGKS